MYVHMQYFLILTIASVAVVMDLVREKISNYLILLAWSAGLFWQLWRYGWWGWVEFLAGSIVPIAFLFFLFLPGMLGAGDIKLFSAIGGIMGVVPIVKCIAFSLGFGAVFSIAFMVLCGNVTERFRYFGSYMNAYLNGKNPGPYRKSGKRMENFHFSVPILMSTMLFVGGFYA